MKVKRIDLADAEALAGAYNQMVPADGVPHCWAVTPGEFSTWLFTHEDEPNPREGLHSDALIACEEAGDVAAYSHVALGEIEVDDQKKSGGFIRFMACRRRHRAAAAAVIEESERYLASEGAERFWALQPGTGPRYYHMGFTGVSDKAAHLYGLLGRKGYEADCGEIFMRMPRIDVEVPPLPADGKIQVEEYPHRGDLPNVESRALVDGKKIGECGIRSAGDYCEAPDAQRTCFVLWLGVDDKWQGSGWGRVLLMKALERARELGYETASISTDWRNYRALTFYTNYGLRVTDTVYGLAKRAG